MDEVKPTFQLNMAQKILLATKERESFNRHCKKFNWNPKEKEHEFYEDFIKRDRELFEGLSQRVDGDNYKKLVRAFDPLFSSENYWEYMHLQKAIVQEAITDSILQAAPSLPINYVHSSKIARIMGLADISGENTSSLNNFLLNVPLMNLFDLEFNAFLTGDSLIEDIPSVCIYSIVPELAEFFTNLFLSCLVVNDREHRVAFPSLVDLSNYANKPGFNKSCLSGFKGILGEIFEVFIVPKHYFSKLHPRLTVEFLSALHGLSSFVKFHEYGHLLMGHLEREPSPSLELEADAFAARVLVKTAKNNWELQWIALGIAILFNILEIIEVLNPTDAMTHPKAVDRLSIIEEEFQGIKIAETAFACELMWSPLIETFNVLN